MLMTGSGGMRTGQVVDEATTRLLGTGWTSGCCGFLLVLSNTDNDG
jgi:hypothetical protein